MTLIGWSDIWLTQPQCFSNPIGRRGIFFKGNAYSLSSFFFKLNKHCIGKQTFNLDTQSVLCILLNLNALELGCPIYTLYEIVQLGQMQQHFRQAFVSLNWYHAFGKPPKQRLITAPNKNQAFLKVQMISLASFFKYVHARVCPFWNFLRSPQQKRIKESAQFDINKHTFKQ